MNQLIQVMHIEGGQRGLLLVQRDGRKGKLHISKYNKCFNEPLQYTFYSSLSNWTPKLVSKEYVASELDRAFQSWVAYANIDFVSIDDYYKEDIRVAFGRYSHGD